MRSPWCRRQTAARARLRVLLRWHPRPSAPDPLAIRLGRVVGVDVQHGQTGCAGHGHGRVVKLDPQHLVEVRCGVGADRQHFLARVRERERGGGRKRVLPTPPFPVKTDAGSDDSETRSGPASARFALPRARNAAAVHQLPVDHDGGGALNTERLISSGFSTLTISTSTPKPAQLVRCMPMVLRHLLQPDPRTLISTWWPLLGIIAGEG